MKKWRILIALVGLILLLGVNISNAGYADHYTQTDDVGQYKAPSRGTSHILVIRVQVNDKPHDWAPWEAFFDNDAPGMTFRNYYRLMSGGIYDPIVTLTDPIEYATCPSQFSNPTRFPDCSIARGDVMALLPGMQLFHEIFQRLEVEQPWIDLSEFDINGLYGEPDGWTDGVLMMSNLDFTGIALPTSMIYDVEITWDVCLGIIDTISPYLGGLSIPPEEFCPLIVGLTPEQLETTPPWNLLYKLESQGIKIGMIGIASTLDDPIVPIHEFGHVLGFGDLYREHYVGDPPETRHIPGLKYSLMGSYGSLGFPQLDGFSRMRIGWAWPIEIKGTMRVSIPPVLDSGVVYYFRHENEMFVVENRGPSGEVDNIFTKNGLSVYHVNLDEEPDPSTFGIIEKLLFCLNCNDWAPFIMNEQADGLFELQLGLPLTAGDNDLFHTGDEFLPGPVYEAPISPTNLVFDSNSYHGRYTGFSITEVDSDSEAPNILVTLSDNSWSAPIAAETTVNTTRGGCSASTHQADSGIWMLLIPLAMLLFTHRIRAASRNRIA